MKEADLRGPPRRAEARRRGGEVFLWSLAAWHGRRGVARHRARLPSVLGRGRATRPRFRSERAFELASLERSGAPGRCRCRLTRRREDVAAGAIRGALRARDQWLHAARARINPFQIRPRRSSSACGCHVRGAFRSSARCALLGARSAATSSPCRECYGGADAQAASLLLFEVPLTGCSSARARITSGRRALHPAPLAG